jgi:hypothetical protein
MVFFLNGFSYFWSFFLNIEFVTIYFFPKKFHSSVKFGTKINSFITKFHIVVHYQTNFSFQNQIL